MHVVYSQITVTSVEEIELLKEEVMSSPVLLRVWAEYVNNDYIGAAHPGPQFEGKTVMAGCFRVLKHPPAPGLPPFHFPNPGLGLPSPIIPPLPSSLPLHFLPSLSLPISPLRSRTPYIQLMSLGSAEISEIDFGAF